MSNEDALFARVAALEQKVSLLLSRMGIDENSVSTAPNLDLITKLVMQDKIIEAIKEYRRLTGTGLAEAKIAVDQICGRLGH